MGGRLQRECGDVHKARLEGGFPWGGCDGKKPVGT